MMHQSNARDVRMLWVSSAVLVAGALTAAAITAALLRE